MTTNYTNTLIESAANCVAEYVRENYEGKWQAAAVTPTVEKHILYSYRMLPGEVDTYLQGLSTRRLETFNKKVTTKVYEILNF